MRTLLRALRIARIALQHRLDTFLTGTALAPAVALLRPFVRSRSEEARADRGERLRLALQELGPIFVKFGQVLSTRRDLLPPDIADALALLQDQVAPFAGTLAEAEIEACLGAPVGELFAEFAREPLASASIAQVHAARLHDGREVVVKVLRPAVERQVRDDLALLWLLARAIDRVHPEAERIRPLDVVAEIQRTLLHELDLQREGANASVLRRHFADSPDLYVPEVHWRLSGPRVLTLERVRGIRADDRTAIVAAGIDPRKLAAKGIKLFYTQVFRDNFFHADAHPGNIWIDPTRIDEPRFIALDFGIIGTLSEIDRYWLAENFNAMFARDYQRIAKLHLDAGWMPGSIDLEELTADVRTVCEPYFSRPWSEIALGEVLLRIFQMARKNKLTIQPQLILLQKTLLNIEGLGRTLDPELDIWAVAQPVLTDILRAQRRPRAVARRLRQHLPAWLRAAPHMPELAHEYLQQAVRGDARLRLTSDDLAALARSSREGQRQTVLAILGAALAIAAAITHALDTSAPRLLGMPLASWVLATGAAAAFIIAWPRR